MTTTVALATLVLATSLTGCQKEQHAGHAGRYPSAIERLAVRRAQPDPLVESRTRGRQVYEHYCQICHGPEAQGNGFNAAMLDPPPRNFSDKAFWNQTDDEQLQKVIGQGGEAVGKSSLMPPWGLTISERQILDVIAFLRTTPELAVQAAKEAAKEAEASNEAEASDDVSTDDE